ncbi:MAG: hypothetical protein HFE49_04700 [Clostridia bacterium]|nr:hypothetical protein [Clostridia bacterium]
MEEKRTGGGKEFVFSVIWAVILLCIGRVITNLLENYKIIGVIITIIMFCVLGFFVLTRYSAVYTFTFKDDRLRVNRSIGHRNKEVDFAVSEIESVTRSKPENAPKTTVVMRASVFTAKNLWYIIYEKNRIRTLLICDMSKNMADRLKSRTKNVKA